MKFAIAKEHKDFFYKHGWIEFENFVSPEQLLLINAAVDQALADRLKIPLHKLPLHPSETFFLHGRDLSRSIAELRSFVLQARFSEIASELLEKKPLRLGYDQLFPARFNYPDFSINQKSKKPYQSFIEQAATIEEVSSLEGVLGGLMICLKKESKQNSHTKFEPNGIDIFPKLPGQVIFFGPSTLINWNNLYSHEGHRFYLIVYAQLTTLYQLKSRDSHAHYLKQLGYIINEKLTDKLNPIVYR